MLERVSAVELKVQYREYVRRLECLSKEPSKRKLSDMELLELFLLPQWQHLYKDIETVMSLMVRAALMMTVESKISTTSPPLSQVSPGTESRRYTTVMIYLII